MPKKPSKMPTKKETRELPFRSRAIRISRGVKKAAKGWLKGQKKKGGWPFR